MVDCPPTEVLPDEAAELEADLKLGPLLDNGKRQLNEDFVDNIGGLKICVFSAEHPPPHFRVSFQGESANFTITTCDRLPKQLGLEKFERNIRKWWKQNKLTLAQTWNAIRPTDCTVGVVDTVTLGWEPAPDPLPPPVQR
jgi:hypothetical protein